MHAQINRPSSSSSLFSAMPARPAGQEPSTALPLRHPSRLPPCGCDRIGPRLISLTGTLKANAESSVPQANGQISRTFVERGSVGQGARSRLSNRRMAFLLGAEARANLEGIRSQKELATVRVSVTTAIQTPHHHAKSSKKTDSTCKVQK